MFSRHFFVQIKEVSWENNSAAMYVVSFDQPTGALHAVYWLKSFFWALKRLFLSQTEKKESAKYVS